MSATEQVETGAADAARKLVAGFGNQTTIADIAAVGAMLAGCAKAKIESIQLAKEIGERQVTWTKADIAKALKAGLTSAQEVRDEKDKKAKMAAKAKRKAAGEDKGEWLPAGFKSRPDKTGGAWFYRIHGDDGEYEDRVCCAFAPVAICKDAGGGNVSLLVMVPLNGEAVPLRIPIAEMTGNASAGLHALSVAGLTIMPGQEKIFLTLLGEALASATTEIETADAPGWKCPDDSGCPTIYVASDGTNIEKGKTLPAPDERRQPRVLLTAPLKNQVAGNWQGYRDAAHACWRSGLAHFQIAPMSAMAGVLGSFYGGPTTIFSDTGPSTSGKSTVEQFKAAAIGNPTNNKGPYQTLKATANASEIALAASNHGILCYDETGLYEGNLEDLLMMIAEGVGKGRAQSDMRPRKSKSWCTSVHLSSEHSIDEMLRAGAKAKGKRVRQGVTVRCLDIPVVKRKLPDDLFRPIKEVAPGAGRQSKHFGHLVRMFVRQLFEDNESPDAVAARIEEKARTLAAGGDLVQLRVARTFATVWECGGILKRFDGLPADADVETFIRSLWRGFIKGETARNLDSAGAAIEDLKNYLAKTYPRHGQNVDHKGIAPFGELKFYYKDENGNAAFWILKNDFAELLATASLLTANEADVLRKLADAEILQRQKADRLVCSYIPAHGRFACYHLLFEGMNVSSQQPLDDDEAAAAAAADRAEAESAAECEREEAAATAVSAEREKAEAIAATERQRQEAEANAAEREAAQKVWRARGEARMKGQSLPPRRRVF